MADDERQAEIEAVARALYETWPREGDWGSLAPPIRAGWHRRAIVALETLDRVRDARDCAKDVLA